MKNKKHIIINDLKIKMSTQTREELISIWQSGNEYDNVKKIKIWN